MAEAVALTVSAALNLAKDTLRAYPLRIVGEISGFKPHSTYRAFYFQLKDESSVMEVTLWRNVYSDTGVELKDGMIVELSGHFDVYPARGSMSFIPRHIKVAGEGDLRAQIAALANKLKNEGLMDEARKKSLPWLPERIGVITSANGAAIHDVLRTLARRYPLAEVLFFGTLVEGHGAAKGIVTALKAADSHAPDVILLVRGGGSFEDLLPFSDEEVARTIAACETPVVTGVGHEPDYSIADMVADVRASTPTAAAETVVPARDELEALLAGHLAQMIIPLDQFNLRVDALQQRLEQALPGKLEKNALHIEALLVRLEQAIPGRLARDEMALGNLTERFRGVGSRMLERPRTQLTHRGAQLEALSPLKVLGRGYAAVFDSKTHSVVDSIHKVTSGEQLTVQVADGSIFTIVERTAGVACEESLDEHFAQN
ncbi:MAG: exodeoxyribonuclease VII large subunit [Coriobacteriia bacterium]|nr:exodeoxyribonuclease VII large subunit [Coriobacteriia bacterium]